MNNKKPAISEEYKKIWNAEEQARIDADIEKYRKADAKVTLPKTSKGRKITVKQKTHDFIFGAHIFNFNQLGKKEYNDKYKSLYGSLFNSGTVSFYWDRFEPEEGKMRFEETETDTEEYWNNCKDPMHDPFWRRPTSDVCINFLKEKGLRVHAHPLVWGHLDWNYPKWMLAKLPKDLIIDMAYAKPCGFNAFNKYTAEELNKMIPTFADDYWKAIIRRIEAITQRYGDKIDSVDVVNESAMDYDLGNLPKDENLAKCIWYKLMPGDYAYKTFKLAEKYFAKSTKLNINDFYVNKSYKKQMEELIDRDCQIDIQGLQMHLFNPQLCKDIADGKIINASLSCCPETIRKTIEESTNPNIPIHLSEITITSAGEGEEGEEIQATIARNLYRIWFSIPHMMGITWWNVVDGCGAAGEPNISGLFTRDMKAKKAYYALDNLINHEWRTNLELEADDNGEISFRGFRGMYEISWVDDDNVEQTQTVHVK